MAKQIFLPSDGPTGTPSLRTLGTGALQAGPGNDSRFSDARTPTAHASTHDVGGSDVLKDLTRLAAGPALLTCTAWNIDFEACSHAWTPLAGFIYLMKVMTAHAFTINNVDCYVSQAGTGVTALANAFIGIYDSGGTRRFVSSDQSSTWNSTGNKSASVSGGYTVTANDFVWIAFLVGTQSTTNLQFWGGASNAVSHNGALTASVYRAAFQGSGSSTSLPSSFTPSTNGLSNFVFWAAVK